MISIINKKYYKGFSEYVGRPSVLGNMYSSKDSSIAKYKTDSVEESIKLYKEWIINKINNEDDEILSELYRLSEIAKNGHLILGCWCFPFTKCHAEVIKEIIELILENDNEDS